MGRSLKASSFTMGNEKGFILPFTLMFLSVILTVAVASKDLYVSKYRYLTNMQNVYERKISLYQTVLYEMEAGSGVDGLRKGSFGTMSVDYLEGSGDLQQIEVRLNQPGEVFLPVAVVYNKDTKKIVDWK
ncbi:hypothetical protein KV679_08655 [Bacillus sp. JRC01]|nr:hypothetical protein [Bacillus sp. JRC01]